MPEIEVAVIVPLAELVGDEVLVVPGDESAALPAGVLLPGERLLDAAVRIVHETAGFRPIPMRILYLLERRDCILLFGILCGLPPDIEDNDDLRGEFLSITHSKLPLEPMAFREVLVEDLRSGFVRPVAHLVETPGEFGPEVQITW